VPDRVCVVWVGLLEKPLEVIRRWPRWTVAAAHGGRHAPCTGAAHLPAVSIITVGHGHRPLKALFARLVAAFYALLGTMSGDVGQRLLVTALHRFPASLC
jgi:hypothetical protein